MKKILMAFAMTVSLVFATGCGNLSPRQEQEIDNRDGKIGEIENLANSMKNEMLNLKSQSEIQNSRLDRIQQGLANFQSNYENSGIQILSGPGGLVFSVIALTAMFVLLVHYRGAAKRHEKTANIIAQSLVRKNDPELEDNVFLAAMNSDVEEDVLKIMSKQQSVRRNRR